MRIVGPPSAPQSVVLRVFREQVTRRATSATVGAALALATEVVGLEYGHGQAYRLDAAGLVAQVALETGWLTFGGRIDARWRNVCGLKVRDPGIVTGATGDVDTDQPLAHAQFGTWSTGVLAHVQHVAAYAGVLDWSPLHVVDPRAAYPAPPWAETWDDLGGRWAPAKDYGAQVGRIAALFV